MPYEYLGLVLPGSIVVRELRYRIEVPGFRTREVTPVTTLLDERRRTRPTRWRRHTRPQEHPMAEVEEDLPARQD